MLRADRPFAAPGILLGTSAFTAAGWQGSFYPAGMKPTNFLTYYATQFGTVEVDSTFYRTPSVSTVNGWYEKTPPDFVFAAKVPQVITHEKVLVDCEAEFDEFIGRMDLLDDKLGPLLLQFPYFNQSLQERWRVPCTAPPRSSYFPPGKVQLRGVVAEEGLATLVPDHAAPDQRGQKS